MPIIKTESLTKKFKDLLAVDDVSLEVEKAECFGLLGPNGAGKTSLIRMITAVSPPTKGDIWVLGKTIKELDSRGLDFDEAGDKIHIFHIEAGEQVAGLVNFPECLRRRPATLEDVFFRLTGRSLIE